VPLGVHGLQVLGFPLLLLVVVAHGIRLLAATRAATTLALVVVLAHGGQRPKVKVEHLSER
jgi:hypothetical protein